MIDLCYFTYLIAGVAGILINIGMGKAFTVFADSIGGILMVLGIFIFPYLLLITIFSLLKFKEKALFALGVATLVEFSLQYITRLSPNNTIIYYSLLFPYLVGITAVPFYRLFVLSKDKGQPNSN
jgi:hypothetical protein